MNSRKIVIPGDLLTTERKKLGPNVYSVGKKVYSKVIGILSESESYISVIPLNGTYMPKEGDNITLIVSSEVATGYVLDFNSTIDTYFSKNSLNRKLEVGTLIFAKIDRMKNDGIEIDNINILPKGRIFVVSSVKVPRLIGKNDSMINILKEYTKSNIIIGKNGWIWYNSQNPELLEKAINLIINNSQKTNLTNNIKLFLEKNTK